MTTIKKYFRINLILSLRILILLFLIFLLANCSIIKNINQLSDLQSGKFIVNSESNPGRLEYLENYPVIHLYGNPAEMGRQYGTLLKTELNSFFSILEIVFSEKDMAQYISQAKETEKHLPPEIVEEIKAISHASEIDYEKLLALNITSRVECSTLATWGESTSDGKLIMGRNAEYSTKGLNKLLGLIVVRHPDNGYANINITYLGMVGGFSGMNENGICYANMLSYNSLNDSINNNGMPIQLLLRMGGETSANPNEYKDFLFHYNLIVPNIVMIADKNEAIITEHNQNDHELRTGYKNVLAATNFFQTSKLASSFEPDERYFVLLNEVKNRYGEITSNDIMSIMHLASNKGKNLQCIIFMPEEMKLWVSMNKKPASKGPFTLIDVDSLFNQ